MKRAALNISLKDIDKSKVNISELLFQNNLSDKAGEQAERKPSETKTICYVPIEATLRTPLTLNVNYF